MEAHDEFQRSLVEMGKLISRMAEEFQVKERDRTRAGVSGVLYQRILDGNLPEPLSDTLFSDVVRTFELKIPDFRKKDQFVRLEKTWRWTQRVYAQNGGKAGKSAGAEERPASKDAGGQNFSAKKHASWILSTLLKKLLRVELINRTRFQQETGISRGFFEEVVRGEYRFTTADEVVSGVADYAIPLLSEQEAEILRNALQRGNVYLSAVELEAVTCSIGDAEARKARAAQLVSSVQTARDSWTGKSDEEILEEIFECFKTPGELLGNLMSFRNLEADDLADEANCPVKAIADLIRGANPLSRKTAKTMSRVLELDGDYAVIFFEAMVTLQIPDRSPPPFFPPAVIVPGMIHWVMEWLRQNALAYRAFFCVVGAISRGAQGNGNRSGVCSLVCLPLPCEVVVDVVVEIPVEFAATDQKKVFAVLLREARKAKRLSQAELARKAGCSSGTVSAAECGRTIPLGDYVKGMAKALGFRGEKKDDFYAAAGIN